MRAQLMEWVQALINRLCVQAAIEQYYGVSLATTPPEVLQTVVQQARAAGNEAYRKRQYAGIWKLKGLPCNVEQHILRLQLITLLRMASAPMPHHQHSKGGNHSQQHVFPHDALHRLERDTEPATMPIVTAGRYV